MPWTEDWLKFDNAYFQVLFKRDEGVIDDELVALETDLALVSDPEFKEIAQKYCDDQDVFFKDYVVSHQKLSELGAKWADQA